MANVFFIGDMHLGHKNIQNFRPERTEEQQYEWLKDSWHYVVGKRDTVYCMGDVAFSHERLEQFSKWQGRKILVCGNHDLDQGPCMKEQVKYYDDVFSLLKYKEFWLSHCPIHPDELRGRMNIHGHTHNHIIQDNRYINVCVENLVNGQPIGLDRLRRMIELKQEEPIVINRDDNKLKDLSTRYKMPPIVISKEEFESDKWIHFRHSLGME